MTVQLKDVAWNAQAEDLLTGATGNDPTYTIAELKEEVLQGKARLFAVLDVFQTGTFDVMGYIVLHIEQFGGAGAENREVILKAGAAMGNTSDALKRTMPEIQRYKRMNNCGSIRAHTSDVRIERALRIAGFREAEKVFRIN